jgi:hypothetical protein
MGRKAASQAQFRACAIVGRWQERVFLLEEKQSRTPVDEAALTHARAVLQMQISSAQRTQLRVESRSSKKHHKANTMPSVEDIDLLAEANACEIADETDFAGGDDAF